MKTTETRNLKVILTQGELQEKGKALAKANQGIAEKEAQKKQVDSQIKAEITRYEAEVLSLSSAIQNGYEYRDIECSWSYRWFEGKKYLVRTDTYEQLEVRPITEAERQQHLDFENARNTPAEPDPELKRLYENTMPAELPPVTDGCDMEEETEEIEESATPEGREDEGMQEDTKDEDPDLKKIRTLSGSTPEQFMEEAGAPV